MKAKNSIAKSICIIIGAITFTACGSSTEQKASTDITNTEATEAPKASTPKMTINEADWTEKNLQSISPLTPISLKLPKDAKMEKNMNGGVDITLSDFYMITVSQLASSSIKEAMDLDKSAYVNSSFYQNSKLIIDEPNGYVYTRQMKDETNGIKYEPEAHFVYYLEKDGAIYSILDQAPLSADINISGSAYSEGIAKQVYNIVKSSAKVN